MASTKRKASGELASPPHKRHHPDDYEANEQAPPPNSPPGQEPTSTSPAVSQSSAAPQTPPESPLRVSPLPSSPSVPSSVAEEEDNDDVLCRIQSGIDYVRKQQEKGEAIKQTTRFELANTSPSLALSLLRRHALLIYTSTTHDVYELGVPRPDWVTAGILGGLHDPQWWLAKSAAETKAGPHAEESDIKRAAAHLKGLQTKKNKKNVTTAQKKEIEWKLREGTRRQKMGLRMYGSESEETEGESEVEEMWVNRGVESEEKGEEDLPVRRGVRSMAAKAPRSRARLSVIEEVAESEIEEDIPIIRDPRYTRIR